METCCFQGFFHVLFSLAKNEPEGSRTSCHSLCSLHLQALREKFNEAYPTFTPVFIHFSILTIFQQHYRKKYILIQSAHFFLQMQTHNFLFVLLEFHVPQAVPHTVFLRFAQELQLRCPPMLLLFVYFSP